ncbi:MAG: NAD(P)/FAD-dependent oxidoreductase [Chitinophagaceae bacterium]
MDTGLAKSDTSSQNYDVVVIGSGPAGIAAAINCKLQGLQTVLITKAPADTHTFEKNVLRPTESVHPGISSLLKTLQAEHVLHDSSTGMYEGIQTGNQYAALGSDAEGAWKGHHIDRSLFNAGLLQCAQAQGVYIVTGETVDAIIEQDNSITGIKTVSGKTFTAKYVIDASGRARLAGKKLKFKERYISPPLVSWTGVSGPIDNETFSSLKTSFIPEPNGWTWLAPASQAYCTWTRLARKGEKDFRSPKELEHFALAGNVQVANMRWRIFRPLCTEGLVLCGDAAGIIDPAAGQGILNAICSGIYAARTVIACFANPALASFYLAQYDDWYLSQFQEKADRLKQYYAEQGVNVF